MMQVIVMEGFMRSRRNAEHIRRLLQQASVEHSQGLSWGDIARKLGVSTMTLLRWRRRYEGAASEEVGRVLEVQWEVERLKRLVAELLLDKQMLQDVAKKKW